MSFDGLVRSAVSGFSGDLSFQVLECRPDLIALGLFFIEFVLKLKRHSVVSVLGLLELYSGLVNLRQNVEVFMLIHGGLSCFVDKNVIFLPQLFDFSLEHSVGIDEGIISVFGLVDSHLELLFNLFVRTHLFFKPSVLGLLFLFFLILLVLLVLGILLIFIVLILFLMHFFMSFGLIDSMHGL